MTNVEKDIQEFLKTPGEFKGDVFINKLFAEIKSQHERIIKMQNENLRLLDENFMLKQKLKWKESEKDNLL